MVSDNRKKRSEDPGSASDPNENDEAAEEAATASRLNPRLSRTLIWIFEYWRELFDFRFDKYMIIQVLPGVYGLLLTGIGASLLYISVEAFLNSPWRGLFYLFIAAPLIFLVAASVLRALLEFYVVVFRIAENVDQLVGMRDTVDRLSGISDTVDELSAMTRRLPFWKAVARRRQVRPEREAAEPTARKKHKPSSRQ